MKAVILNLFFFYGLYKFLLNKRRKPFVERELNLNIVRLELASINV